MKRLHRLPDDPINCPLEELTAGLSCGLISRREYSCGGNILSAVEQLKKQRQSTKRNSMSHRDLRKRNDA